MMNSTDALTPLREKGTFKERFTFQQRRTQSLKLQEQFPGYVLVIIEPARPRKEAEEKDTLKTKFIVPAENTLGQFLVRFRKQVKLKDDDAVFVFTSKETMPSNAQTMSTLFSNHADEDGFLYLTFAKENTFGKFFQCDLH